MQLREALSIGYLESKGILRAVVKKPGGFCSVPASYMANSNAPGVVRQYKPVLAELLRRKVK